MAQRYVGEGLGIKAIRLNEPFLPDSGFDSTVRIPIKAPRLAPRAPGVGGSAALGGPTPGFPATQAPLSALPAAPQPPQPQPQVQPQPPAVQPTPIAQPTTLGQPDPSQLNFEGSTYQPGISPTTPTNQPDTFTANRLVEQLQQFTGGDIGIKLPADWRALAGSNPDELLRQVSFAIEERKKGGNLHRPADTSMRNRLDDWFRAFSGAVKKQGSAPNSDYQIGALGQSVFNSAVQRLKTVGAQDTRDQDEQLLSQLASRGLLNSGIAARELTRLRGQREQNFFDAASRLNELLLQGDIGRLTQRDLAGLEADLQKRNQEAYLKLQQRLIEASQPNPWVQGLTTIAGIGASFLPAPKAPGIATSQTPGGSGIFTGLPETTVQNRADELYGRRR